jgi:hypothetical protein
LERARAPILLDLRERGRVAVADAGVHLHLSFKDADSGY